ncbi:MAG TPA: histidine kinase [Solirubrobacteraceae bacterium]|nr:histidine kinase [Solirubrobacteraceae bacterium]
MRRFEHNPRLVDAAIAAAAFALSVVLVAVGDKGLDAPGVALAAASTLPLVARRRAPLAVFVVTGIAASALHLVAEPGGPPVGPTIALFGVAETTSRAALRPVLVIVMAVLVAHLAAAGLAADRFPGPELAFAIALWGGTWLAGERTRIRRERMAELEERAERAEREAERERRLAAAEQRMRIARDLHDSAGHAINVILVHAGLGRLKTESDPAAARAAFETIEEVARETVGEIDQLVRVLREDGGGEGVEPPPGIAALDGLLERQRAAGLAVTMTLRGNRRPLPASTDRAAYRIVQEALTNAARHGDGSAEVELAYDADAIVMTVANPAASATNGHGHGIIGMRERAALLGGTLDAAAHDGRFEVRARLPL